MLRLEFELRRKHLTYGGFCREYDRVAGSIDSHLIGTAPGRAQFYRWLRGDVKGLPYPDRCRVLEAMFPGCTVAELFGLSGHGSANSQLVVEDSGRADIETVFASRSDFLQAMPPQQWLGSARTVDLMGISLNLLCQQSTDTDIVRMPEAGATIRCLFLDPAGEHIALREAEEGHVPGTLTNLTRLNIRVLERLRRLVSAEVTGRIEIRTYDAIPRFNLTMVDGELCVMQPYLPHARGVESPTFVARRSNRPAGIFSTFDNVFESAWSGARRAVSQ
ncbi:DUF5919 domain-containing protein [Nocardia sp. NPDC057227]|uniref:DUF5919 domain-containing protein n=1 Tax=Nocardia sp. NPDC057227 TaxID=3346056 RepID=UPI00362EE0B0